MLTAKSIKDYVLGLSGTSSVSVELEDDDFELCVFPRTLEVYNKYRPKLIEYPLTITPGVQEYKLLRSIVGTGVWDVIPQQKVSESYGLFPSSYYPINSPGYSLNSQDLLRFRINNIAERKILGQWDDFQYNQDTNILKIFPVPQRSQRAIVLTMHSRYQRYGTLADKGDGTKTVFDFNLVDEDGFKLINITPGSVMITYKDIKYRDAGDGTMECNKVGGSGTIDYKTGQLSITFATAPLDQELIQWELLEVLNQDEAWYRDYARALADIILGRKRKKFSIIPGSQQQIDLYVDILNEGNELKSKLEEDAKQWLTNWTIPRTL